MRVISDSFRKDQSMATFTNQATLTYNGTSVLSNVVVGECLEPLTLTKTASGSRYTRGEALTYVLALRNTGNTALNGLRVTDDLGAYTTTGGVRVTPLTYVDGSVLVFEDGVLQPAPTITAGQTLVFDGISVPANGETIIVYRATPNVYAPLGPGAVITNTATVCGAAGVTPVSASETVTAISEAQLRIEKRIEPTRVEENGTLTYTFIITNYGNTPATAEDSVVLTDVFDPILHGLTATYEGTRWTEGTEYTYDEVSGTFTSTAGAITVPAATYTQDPATGTVTVIPGSVTLVITGTV